MKSQEKWDKRGLDFLQEIKTNPEKYIIKESAVTVSPYSWDKRINSLDNFIKDREANYIKCLKDLSEKDCTDIYKFRQEEFKALLKKAKDWRDKPEQNVNKFYLEL